MFHTVNILFIILKTNIKRLGEAIVCQEEAQTANLLEEIG